MQHHEADSAPAPPTPESVSELWTMAHRLTEGPSGGVPLRPDGTPDNSFPGIRTFEFPESLILSAGYPPGTTVGITTVPKLLLDEGSEEYILPRDAQAGRKYATQLPKAHMSISHTSGGVLTNRQLTITDKDGELGLISYDFTGPEVDENTTRSSDLPPEVSEALLQEHIDAITDGFAAFPPNQNDVDTYIFLIRLALENQDTQ